MSFLGNLFKKKVTDKSQSQQSQEHQKTVAEVVSKAILKSEGQLEGMAALEYIDVIRAICNSGFSKESIYKGLHHSNYKIRALVEEFLKTL